TTAEHCRQRLVGDADQVDLGLLVLQRTAGRLGMETQLPRSFFASTILVAQDLRPQDARRPVLGDLLEDVIVSIEKETQTRGKDVDIQATRDADVDVVEAVGQRKGQFL